MVERGASPARTLFAFNSVNVEGWTLYAEAETAPYEPLDGQLIPPQFRLVRAARGMLGPMSNPGMSDRERPAPSSRSRRVVEGDGAAGTRPLRPSSLRPGGQLLPRLHPHPRTAHGTEPALGPKFDRLAFNDFLLDQGLLQPELLAAAVGERFIPAQRDAGPARR